MNETKISDGEETQLPERKIEPIEVSYQRATELYNKYKDQIFNIWFGEGEPPEGEYFPNKAIKRFLDKIPDKTRELYWGHGITRGSEIDHLAAAINIASNRAIIGWAGRLSSEGYGAWSDGSFIVISPKGEELMIKENGRRVFLEGDMWKANIGAIVVNSYFYPLVEELKSMFPDLKIIKASELPGYFNETTEN